MGPYATTKLRHEETRVRSWEPASRCSLEWVEQDRASVPLRASNGLRVSGKPRCPARRDGHPARSLRTRPQRTIACLGVAQAGP